MEKRNDQMTCQTSTDTYQESY